MKIRTLIYFALCLHISTIGLSQDKNSSLSKVDIGQKMPDYTFKKLKNFESLNSSIGAFKGKILILDFWSSMCGSCVKSWPELINLQNKYQDKVQIILVNSTEDDNVINNAVARQEKIRGYKMTLVMANGEKDLKVLFPHTLVPHVVYIDPSGIVKYITTGVTEGIVESLLAQKELKLIEKKDDYADIVWSKPLFINGNTAKDDVGKNVIFSSVITPYSPNMYPMVDFIDSEHNILDGRTVGVIANRSLSDTFRFLYGRDWMEWHWVYPVPKSRIEYRNVDTAKLVRIVGGVPQEQNLYTIQVTAKNSIPISRIREKMIDDLEQNFSLVTKWEKQEKLCFVISKTNSPITVYKSGVDSILIGGRTLNFNKISMLDFIDRIIYYTPALKKYPVVDETNFRGVLGNISLNADKVADYVVLNKALSKHGMQISIKKRMVDILVIAGVRK